MPIPSATPTATATPLVIPTPSPVRLSTATAAPPPTPLNFTPPPTATVAPLTGAVACAALTGACFWQAYQACDTAQDARITITDPPQPGPQGNIRMGCTTLRIAMGERGCVISDERSSVIVQPDGSRGGGTVMIGVCTKLSSDAAARVLRLRGCQLGDKDVTVP